MRSIYLMTLTLLATQFQSVANGQTEIEIEEAPRRTFQPSSAESCAVDPADDGPEATTASYPPESPAPVLDESVSAALADLGKRAMESGEEIQPVDYTAGSDSEGTKAAGVISDTVPAFIRLNSQLTYEMLDFQNRQTDKELLILRDARAGVAGPHLSVGAQVRGSALFGRTNTRDRFPYLGRFPTDFTGTTVSDMRLLQSNQAIVAHANSWAHGYFETLFSDVFSFPTFEQGSFQVRQAYLVLGDLNASPFYAFLGKKNVSFGSFETLSPFTQAVPWHYFSALTEGGGIGYSSDGLNVQVMALNGGRGIRVADSNNFGHINNFAANVRYEKPLGDDAVLVVGAGYLHGTIYDVAVPEHIDPTAFGPRNGAWDVNAQLRLGSLRINGEFVQTQRAWPATGHRISAFQIETARDFFVNDIPCTISTSLSEGEQGPGGSQFEFNRQFVVGLKVQPSPNAFFTLEYVRSTGFAPLINITTASDRSVEQNSVVAGFVLSI